MPLLDVQRASKDTTAVSTHLHKSRSYVDHKGKKNQFSAGQYFISDTSEPLKSYLESFYLLSDLEVA